MFAPAGEKVVSGGHHFDVHGNVTPGQALSLRGLADRSGRCPRLPPEQPPHRLPGARQNQSRKGSGAEKDCGYVWPVNRGQTSNAPPVSEAVATYLDRLTFAHPGIRAVWLFGSRANGSSKADSDWDLLAFGDRAILDALRADNTFRHPEVDLFIVHDGNRFESPWPDGDEAKLGRLQNGFEFNPDRYVYGYRWKELSEREAAYVSTRDFDCADQLRAWRVYPS